MRDSGNEFHMLSDAYKHMVVVLVDLLANLKLVTFQTQLSALTSKLYLALAKSELELIQSFKYVGAKQFMNELSNFELNTKLVAEKFKCYANSYNSWCYKSDARQICFKI